MLEALISSKTRVKLLLKFFLNSQSVGYLRGLEQEFGESSNSIRIELNRFEEAGMLISEASGNRKYFRANTGHPLFNEVNNILKKHIGVDRIINKIVARLGDVDEVYLVGDLSNGKNADIVDLLFFGNVDVEYLVQLIGKVEKELSRKIRYLVYDKEQVNTIIEHHHSPLLLWSRKEEDE